MEVVLLGPVTQGHPHEVEGGYRTACGVTSYSMLLHCTGRVSEHAPCYALGGRGASPNTPPRAGWEGVGRRLNCETMTSQWTIRLRQGYSSTFATPGSADEERPNWSQGPSQDQWATVTNFLRK